MRGPAAEYARDDDAANVPEPEGFRQLRRQLLHLYPDPAAHDPAVLENIFQNGLCEVGRNREADTVRAPRLAEDRRVDADQFAVGVDQGAAGVAWVDGGVRLDEVLEGR